MSAAMPTARALSPAHAPVLYTLYHLARYERQRHALCSVSPYGVMRHAAFGSLALPPCQFDSAFVHRMPSLCCYGRPLLRVVARQMPRITVLVTLAMPRHLPSPRLRFAYFMLMPTRLSQGRRSPTLPQKPLLLQRPFRRHYGFTSRATKSMDSQPERPHRLHTFLPPARLHASRVRHFLYAHVCF